MRLREESNKMKLLQLALGLLLLASLAFADQWTGSLIDVMCKDKDPATHTRKCAIACAKSGYGLVVAGGRFLKFDEAGNAQALKALRETPKEQDLKATVTGTLDGDVIQVQSIKIQ
jgi:hypothetical protein